MYNIFSPLEFFFDQELVENSPSVINNDFKNNPKVNLIANDSNYELTAEIPGFTKDEISVELKNNVLIIAGSKTTKNESDNNKNYLIRELKHSNFKRCFTLSNNIDKENIIADFKNGILKIIINKVKPENKTNTIKIL